MIFFALLILYHVLIALIFINIGLKLSYFCQKNKNFSRTGGSAPLHPMPPVAGGPCPRPQLPPVVGGSAPQTPGNVPPPPIADFWLRACLKEKFTARYCRHPFILAFDF